MKVILTKEVRPHGSVGDVIDVSDGYARNFLFPQYLAVLADPAALARISREKKLASRRVAVDLKRSQEAAAALNGFHLKIEARANEQGTLFAALSKRAVAEGLRRHGFKIAENWVIFDEPIKEIGEHHARLNLPHGLEADFDLTVCAAAR